MKLSTILMLSVLLFPATMSAQETACPSNNNCQQQVACSSSCSQPCAQTPNCLPQPCAQTPCAKIGEANQLVQAPCYQQQAYMPYPYAAWVNWRKQDRQALNSSNRIREIGGRGLISYVDGGYYDEYYGEYYDSSYLGNGGGSLYFRAYRRDTGLGVEASWDFIAYHGLEELAQVAVMKYLSLSERMQLYGLIGGGFTIYDPGYSAQAGVGLDLSLTKRLSLHADLRLSHVYTKSDDIYCDYDPACGGGYYSVGVIESSTTNMVLGIGGGWKFASLFDNPNVKLRW